MSTATKPHVATPLDAPTTLIWQSWPLRQKLPWSLLLPMGLLGFEWALSRLSGSHLVGIVAMFLLTASVWRFWIPVRFELSQLGITQRSLGRTSFVPWRMIGAFRICHQGVLLIRNRDAISFDMLDSLYLPWGDQRKEVLEFLDILSATTRDLAKSETTPKAQP